MKPSAIREMGLEDLRHKEKELREQLFRLRVQRALGQIESSMKLRQTRRTIARVLSILKEKQVSR